MIRVVIALSLAIVFGALGDILMSKGMQAREEVHFRSIRDIPAFIKMAFTSPCVLFGICSMAIYFGSYVTALAWVDVSVANPLTALSYVIVTAYAVLFLREHVNKLRWAGVMMITVGAILVGVSS